MKKSTYMDRALKARDPRFARVLEKLGYQRRDMVAEPQEAETDDELSELRAQYQSVFDKRPYHGWDADTLREKIAEAKDGE